MARCPRCDGLKRRRRRVMEPSRDPFSYPPGWLPLCTHSFHGKGDA